MRRAESGHQPARWLRGLLLATTVIGAASSCGGSSPVTTPISGSGSNASALVKAATKAYFDQTQGAAGTTRLATCEEGGLPDQEQAWASCPFTESLRARLDSALATAASHCTGGAPCPDFQVLCACQNIPPSSVGYRNGPGQTVTVTQSFFDGTLSPVEFVLTMASVGGQTLVDDITLVRETPTGGIRCQRRIYDLAGDC